MPSATNDSTRITSIDGYRALAIGAVMLHHVMISPGFPAWLAPWTRSLPRGVVGFWVLSGFLITRSLLIEEQRAGCIQVGHFYLRQAIRYFSPMLGYLLVIGFLIAHRMPGFNWWPVIRPAILDPNTFCIAESVSHLYSLVLQIYFWLALPIVLKMASPRLRLSAALILAISALAWRLIGQPLAVRADGCAGRIDFFFTAPLVGCCFALAQTRLLQFVKRCPRWTLVSAMLGAVAVLFLTADRQTAVSEGNWMRVGLVQAIAPATIYLAWGCLVFSLVHNAVPAANRFLSLPVLTWLGRISFSVYLWQNLFCQGLTETRLDNFPINLLASVLCGYLAYRLIELPSLRVRSWIKRRSAISPAVQPVLSKT